MRITLKQLSIFEAVARSGQVARAAEMMNLSAPATSMALSELEKQLDARLFERVGNRLRLNSQGSLLLPLATEVLQKLEQIEHLFSSAEAELSGTLNVSASSTIGNYLMAKSAVAFCQQHTSAYIDLDIDNTQAVIKSVLEFRTEVGFIEGQCLDSRIKVEAWHKDNLLVFCHTAHPLAGKRVKPVALCGQPWVMREEGSGTRDYFISAANALDMQPIERFSFSTPDAIKQAVKQGAGLAVLSELTLEKELSRKELAVIEVEGLELTRQFYRIHHKSRNFTPLCDAFIAFCTNFNNLSA
ncbi:Transcriptional regulator, LysR family protein [Shewanella benthica]|uniref:Transcriptional regulator, LysR family protein n=1 Tax=Shewanella benthica TaxID=43661 RepID=A0A330M3C5_9GAMM|nr:LysR substrate-binding domain-containing protein [Shewanella benthica]SQH76515.1 Transcriptional regulator, LysR family protein [Shewanella benthica]